MFIFHRLLHSYLNRRSSSMHRMRCVDSSFVSWWTYSDCISGWSHAVKPRNILTSGSRTTIPGILKMSLITVVSSVGWLPTYYKYPKIGFEWKSIRFLSIYCLMKIMFDARPKENGLSWLQVPGFLGFIITWHFIILGFSARTTLRSLPSRISMPNTSLWKLPVSFCHREIHFWTFLW